jgi:hypothetical protein
VKTKTCGVSKNSAPEQSCGTRTNFKLFVRRGKYNLEQARRLQRETIQIESEKERQSFVVANNNSFDLYQVNKNGERVFYYRKNKVGQQSDFDLQSEDERSDDDYATFGKKTEDKR